MSLDSNQHSTFINSATGTIISIIPRCVRSITSSFSPCISTGCHSYTHQNNHLSSNTHTNTKTAAAPKTIDFMPWQCHLAASDLFACFPAPVSIRALPPETTLQPFVWRWLVKQKKIPYNFTLEGIASSRTRGTVPFWTTMPRFSSSWNFSFRRRRQRF